MAEETGATLADVMPEDAAPPVEIEVAPIYDASGMTSRIAADLIYEMLCVLPGVERRDD